MDKNSCRGTHLSLTSEQIVPFPLPGAPSTQTMGGISGNALEGAFPAPAPRLPTGKGAMVWQCTGTTYHEESGNKICWAYLVQTKILCSWTELVSDQHITNYIIWIWPDWRLKAFADNMYWLHEVLQTRVGCQLLKPQSSPNSGKRRVTTLIPCSRSLVDLTLQVIWSSVWKSLRSHFSVSRLYFHIWSPLSIQNRAFVDCFP